MWKCKYCNEEIDYLNYKAYTEGREYGDAHLENPEPGQEPGDEVTISDWEYCDSETTETSDYIYSCPECNHDINLDELIPVTNEEREKEKAKIKEEEPEETTHKIIKPKNEIMVQGKPKDASLEGIICEKCKHIFVYQFNYGSMDEYIECPQCGTTTTANKYLETITKSHDK